MDQWPRVVYVVFLELLSAVCGFMKNRMMVGAGVSRSATGIWHLVQPLIFGL